MLRKQNPTYQGSNQTNLPSVNQVPIGKGIKGNLDTLEVMKRVARERAGHPIVRKLALDIINHYKVPSHYYADEARAIGTHIQKCVAYVKDPTGIEQLHDPLTLIEQINRGVARGDCDDMALLVASLLLSIGHKPKFRVVRYESYMGPYNHIYVVDETNNKEKKQRVVIDCIIKDHPIGYEIPHKSGKEYPI